MMRAVRVRASNVFVIVCDGSKAILELTSEGTTQSTILRMISGGNEGCDALLDIVWWTSLREG